MELLEVFRAAGDLPHGRVGDYLFARLSAEVDEFAARVRDLLPPGAPEPVDVAHEIGGFHVTGRLTGLSVQGCVQMRYAGIKAKDFLTIWLQHLLLCLAAPGVPDRRSLLIGKGQAWASGRCPGPRRFSRRCSTSTGAGSWNRCPFSRNPPGPFSKNSRTGTGMSRTPWPPPARHWRGSDYAPGESENPYYRLCFGDTRAAGGRLQTSGRRGVSTALRAWPGNSRVNGAWKSDPSYALR